MRIHALICGFLVAQVAVAGDDFASFKQQYLQQSQQFADQQRLEYQKFRQEYLAQYDDFRQQLLQFWSQPLQSSVDERVIYTKDLQTRIRIDDVAQTMLVEHLTDKPLNETEIIAAVTLDSNTADEISIALDKEQISSEPAINSEDSEQANLDKKAQSTTAAVETAVNVQLTAQPPLASAQIKQQIESQYQQAVMAIDNGEPAAKQQQEIAQLRAETDKREQQAQQQVIEVSAHQPTYKQIQTHQLMLPKDYTYKKAKPFLEDYQQQVSHYQLPMSLLLAITQTESSFNPAATSHIPAFGLMQIVPRSAGLDVAQKIYQKQQAPTATQLYQPDVNIEYGAGYLSILWYDYFDDVSDLLSRKYCVIAAYNTGAGNVARAFNPHGERSLKKAVKEINQLTPEQVYQTLQQKLPYDETKHYLKKVTLLDNRYATTINAWDL
ncbi:hypothetical protein HR45_01215 [Shewanella mangrovi]|uniref:Transglycosylase SLT domain-containing protein n=1 Tax=Shewanella mangrovi TaxID=1515746 RepID=A0A094K2Y3_9GAMM|nr:transglycosylase SLT domain-containing protein [Shewanella mangrovi]KFZ39046.1 hypothetical protein HR45_01215 [Shewanella mangrovi]